MRNSEVPMLGGTNAFSSASSLTKRLAALFPKNPQVVAGHFARTGGCRGREQGGGNIGEGAGFKPG
jgi:hypothetical protein